jgi:heat shock protein HslJ
MRNIVSLFVVALLSAGCLGSDFADSLQGSWVLVSGSVDGEAIPIGDDYSITLTLEGDRAGGVAACNSYSGTFELSGSNVEFSDMAITEMACFPEDVMRAETLYMQALAGVTEVALDGQLVLTGEDVELTFDRVEPIPDADLTNTVWVLDGLIDNDAVSTPVLDSRATIEFFTDGSMLGETGCRGFSARYDLSGDQVTLEDGLITQDPACEADLEAQDRHILETLADGFRVEIEGDRLIITGPEGLGLTFLAER